MRFNKFFLTGMLTVSVGCMAHAAVSASEAQQLGTTLTKFGAIQAGSADGIIPPYTGGLAAMQNLPAVTPGQGYPDPFTNEKPVFSINSTNMAQYISMLTPGAQALLQRYADYRIDVYPTHRTASYPDWVLANSVKNANTAQIVGDSDGVTGAYGGVPFPIPKTGPEVMWNSFLYYRPASCQERAQGYLVDSSGAVTELGTIGFTWATPYYDQNASSLPGNFWRYYTVRYYTPASEAGTLLLFQFPLDFTKSDDVTWFYSPGTRRVRLAPEYKYDTPAASYGGAIDYDEIALFYGRMNKFTFNLIGEKEMIVPYNDYKMSQTTESAMLGTHFINPDIIRWERHRVWIVDATLKAGERHAYSRWTFYIDEDSWQIVASESYDHSGSIYRVGFAYPFYTYTQGAAATFPDDYGFYDMSKGNYEASNVYAEDGDFWTCSTNLPNMTQYSPQSMAAEAIR